MKDTGHIHLLLPDILWPQEENKLEKPPVRPTRLEKYLTRSRVVPFQGNDLTETMFNLFGIASDSGSDYPVGAVSYFGYGGEPANRCWAKATPVHLMADGDRVLLFGPDQLDIKPNEAESIARDFNDHFKPDGLSLLIQYQDDWYLQLPVCPELTTYDIDFVVGRHIENYLPNGTDRPAWVNIFNETQMLFHQSGVNQQRMALGRATINGLWFSGFGGLPAPGQGYGAIYSSLPLAKGLARLSNTIHYEPQNYFDEIGCIDGETIIVYMGFADSKRTLDLAQWEDALMHTNDCLDRVFNGKSCEEFSIYNCRGEAFLVSRKRLRRGFWKPNKNIFSFAKGRRG
ncbi:MAG: hypothetical protein ABW176_12535 [Candidatus Thiodiazotropha endolucinida]